MPIHERRFFLVDHIDPGISLRPAAELVPVFAAVPLPGFREPVVQKRRVVAPPHGPEECVAEGLAANRRGAVGWNQEPGRPIVFLNRIVENRQVEDRDTLHPEHRVHEQRIVVEVQRHAAGGDIPARCRLGARRETAVDDAVFFRPELLDLVAPERGVRLLRAEQAPVGTLPERHDPVRLEKRSGPRLCVEVHAIGRDAVAGRNEQHVAAGDDAPAIVKDLHAFCKELHAVTVDANRTKGCRHVLFDALRRFHLVGLLFDARKLRHPAAANHRRLGRLRTSWRGCCREAEEKYGCEYSRHAHTPGTTGNQVRAGSAPRLLFSRFRRQALRRNQRRIPRRGPMRKIEPATTT